MTTHNTETATLAGGCFWCIDTVFRELKGVEKVESGYAGGQYPNPSYRDVCSGITGHAEVVRVTFDPTVMKATAAPMRSAKAHRTKPLAPSRRPTSSVLESGTGRALRPSRTKKRTKERNLRL